MLMLNNYRYPHYYPQPEPLKDQYKYAIDRFEMELPMPGYSVKLPFQEKQARFLSVNRRKREIDYLKSHIQHKCDMEEMHYQAKIEQMRRENEFNRLRLQQLLREQPPNIFQIPEHYTREATSLSSNLQKISLRQLHLQNQNHLIDSIDQLKIKQKRTSNSSYQSQKERQILSDGSSQDSQDLAEDKKRRQNDLDYIYKRKGATNQENHFGVMPSIKKEEEKLKEKQKREEYDWIQKVRKAKAVQFVDENDSDDSSKPSSRSSSKKKQQSEVGKKKDNSKSVSSPLRLEESRQNRKGRESTPSKASNRTPSNTQDISNMSQFSRYANKRNLMGKDRKKMQNIFERNEEDEMDDALPLTYRRDREKWKK